MILHTLRRLRRAPLSAIAVLVFAAVLAGVLCGLHAANEAERISYEETRRVIPVRVSVCTLSGTRTDGLEAPGWVADIITGDGYGSLSIAQYLKDVQVKSSLLILNGWELGASNLVGITSLQTVRSLWPENGGGVTWLEGYDESIFQGEELMCLAPESMTSDWDEETPGQQLYLNFSHTGIDEHGKERTWIYECYVTVAGTYTSGETEGLYCPYSTVVKLYGKLVKEREIDSVSATLADNDQLDALREDAAVWFAAPNATGAKTEWGFMDYDFYPYALDIDDSLLQNAAATLENSMLINQLCTLLIFLLSAGAGLFIGFLMIRQRKREIALMRTLGTRDRSIYLGFLLEQMSCVILGVAVGGAAFGWRPPERLAIFVGVYFISLTVALLAALRRNLLAIIKEED